MKPNHLQELLKEIQYLTDYTQAEIAEKIDMDRAYFSSEVKKGTNSTVKHRLTNFLAKIKHNEGEKQESPSTDQLDQINGLLSTKNDIIKRQDEQIATLKGIIDFLQIQYTSNSTVLLQTVQINTELLRKILDHQHTSS